MPPFGSGGLADQQRLIEVRAHALRTRSSTNPPITTGRYTDATERGTLTDTGLGQITSRGGSAFVSHPLGAVAGHVVA
jgi:hypothetical protein